MFRPEIPFFSLVKHYKKVINEFSVHFHIFLLFFVQLVSLLAKAKAEFSHYLKKTYLLFEEKIG